MLGDRQTGGTSPNTLLLGVVSLCILVAVAAIAIAAAPTWLGLHLGPQRETGLLVIQHVVPGGPAALAGARVGDRLIALGGASERPLALTASDVHEDRGEVTQAGVRASMQRYDRVAQALKSLPLRLVLKDAQGQTRTIELQPRHRPLSTLRVEFWANLGFGLLAALICGWVWALRPGERATQLFALTGLSMLGFTTGWAVHSSIELAMDTALLMPALWANYTGATAYGGAMIALFLCYPRPLVRGPLPLLLAPLLVQVAFTIANAVLLEAGGWALNDRLRAHMDFYWDRTFLHDHARASTESGASSSRTDPVRGNDAPSPPSRTTST